MDSCQLRYVILLKFSRNPRGVDDYVLMKIQKESTQKCEEFLGFPVIYELIEVSLLLLLLSLREDYVFIGVGLSVSLLAR